VLAVGWMLALAVLAAGLAGCGGTRQDAGEPSGRYAVEVVHASFPAKQSVAKRELFALVVRNSGLTTAPNVAVTVDSFSYHSSFPELASRKRPIWVVEQGPGKTASPPVESQEVAQPGSGQTAYVSTWALGPLPPHSARLFKWLVVPVKPGIFSIHYRVAPGLAGKAQARPTLRNGGTAGRFFVAIAGKPANTYVDPTTGKVVVGTYPAGKP
jgi:hypothetical protein